MEAVMEVFSKVFANAMEVLAYIQAQETTTLAAYMGGALAAYLAIGMLTAQKAGCSTVHVTNSDTPDRSDNQTQVDDGRCGPRDQL
jgi:hypothetical protein